MKIVQIKITDPKPYQREDPTMSIRAQALRNIVLSILVYAWLWWIA